MATSYPCNACGGNLEYSPKDVCLKCPNCSSTTPIEKGGNISIHPLREYATTVKELPATQKQVLSCKSCSASIEVDATTTATSCPYCASPIVLEDKQVSTVVPDGVRPFKIDKHAVQEAFLNWIKGRWLAPGSLKSLYQQNKIQGVYMPFWVFDAKVDCRYTAEGGRERQESYTDDKGESKTRTVVDWYDTSGFVKDDFKDMPVLASERVSENLADDLVSAANAVSYDPRYLSGYGSEVFSIDMPAAYGTAQKRMENSMESTVRNDVLKRYDQVRNISMDLDFYEEYYKHMLMPLYLSAYTFKGKSYQVVIDGETGAVSGEYPKSYAKIAGIVAAVVAVGYLLYKFMN